MGTPRRDKKSHVMFVTILLAGMTALSLIGSASAREVRIAPDAPPVAPSLAPGPTDAAELGTFLDELLAGQMKEHHIAGAAVSVVKDGKLIFAKGYGYADIANGIPVDPEQTIFRVGSVGKLFTWTAVMQLVEQGKLDLDTDINAYLDFRIPDTYPQPITLKHLLTHTSGFEDRWFGGAVSDANDLVPARDWLASHLWARVNPPGAYARYSNFNAMLAGYIVARASGLPYDQYIQEQILDPLGMVHSTAGSPVPLRLRPHVSVGYTYAGGSFQPLADYALQPGGLPSGAQQASVTDMARFMIAHLQGGRYSDANIAEARILKEATAQQMQSKLYTPDPRLLGTAYGFFDWSDNGQRTLGHTGYSPPMHSVLLLLPDQHLGVFVSYNSEDAGGLTVQHSGFQRAFFDHYYPAPAVTQARPPADFAKRAGRFVGTYNTVSPFTTFSKVVGLFGGGYTTEIRDSGDGALLFRLGGQQSRFVEVEPLYFRQVGGQFALVFREDDRGRITHAFTDLMPQYALLKLDWYETPGFNSTLALGSVLAFLSMIVVSAVRPVWNRLRSSYRKPASNSGRAAHWTILRISILNLLFVAGLMWGGTSGTTNILLDPSPVIKVVLGLGVLSTVLTAGALGYTALAWRNGYWGIAARSHYTLVTGAAVAFVWFLNYWNLLGWRF